MSETSSENLTRIKTGIVLIVAMLLLGYIDSYFLFWLVFGIMLLISISEAKKLFGLKSDSIYIYTGFSKNCIIRKKNCIGSVKIFP